MIRSNIVFFHHWKNQHTKTWAIEELIEQSLTRSASAGLLALLPMVEVIGTREQSERQSEREKLYRLVYTRLLFKVGFQLKWLQRSLNDRNKWPVGRVFARKTEKGGLGRGGGVGEFQWLRTNDHLAKENGEYCYSIRSVYTLESRHTRIDYAVFTASVIGVSMAKSFSGRPVKSS